MYACDLGKMVAVQAIHCYSGSEFDPTQTSSTMAVRVELLNGDVDRVDVMADPFFIISETGSKIALAVADAVTDCVPYGSETGLAIFLVTPEMLLAPVA